MPPVSAHDGLAVSAVSLSVVICCYTTARRTQVLRAIQTTLDQIDARDEIIVVVDHNDDLLADLQSTLPEQIALIANRFERGLSGARNTGVARSRGEVVVFVDDDAVPASGALDHARAAFEDRSVVAIGGAVRADWASGSAPGWFPDEFGWVVGCDYRGLPACGEQIRNPIGAAMAVRRTALVEIEGFSTELGRVGDLLAGCEETLMGVQLHARFPGHRIIRHTGFQVDHHVPAERATLGYFTRRCYQEGRSKAVLARISGRQAALSSERSYTTRILPSGAWRARANPRRVLALVIGFGYTAAGYVTGMALSARSAKAAA
ncbi:Glycosyl transferase family 2 [Mycolicibacterium neoaurum]|uniref:glycosyltransferase family 2 protein n=1 Tax=Mycolicibacterium neoaurum TaxID=1795 RepID=UPI00068AD843|nr:glycosyltransferase family 2 protein [Mycolicibacterium neoaurum]SDE22070.1 Glycosyl transferase family 2 [Mycolicibacterium neoaurum]